MASTFSPLRWIGACAALALLATIAFAQQNLPARPRLRNAAPPNPPQAAPQQPGQQRVIVNRPTTEGAAEQNTDQTIATWLAIGNQAEIAVSQFAQSKVENPEVRKFCEMMVKEHTDLARQLERFGAQPNQLSLRERIRERIEDATARTAAVAPGDQPRTEAAANAQPALDGHRGFNFLNAQREIANHCIATAQKELSEKQGKHRDECLVGMQIGAHQQMISMQKVLREYASPELQSVIDKGLQASESHLDQAKHLMHNLTDNQRTADENREAKS